MLYIDPKLERRAFFLCELSSPESTDAGEFGDHGEPHSPRKRRSAQAHIITKRKGRGQSAQRARNKDLNLICG